MGSIIVSVVIADLIFMQTMWKLVTFITDTYLTHKYMEGNVPHLPSPLCQNFKGRSN